MAETQTQIQPQPIPLTTEADFKAKMSPEILKEMP